MGIQFKKKKLSLVLVTNCMHCNLTTVTHMRERLVLSTRTTQLACTVRVSQTPTTKSPHQLLGSNRCTYLVDTQWVQRPRGFGAR